MQVSKTENNLPNIYSLLVETTFYSEKDIKVGHYYWIGYPIKVTEVLLNDEYPKVKFNVLLHSERYEWMDLKKEDSIAIKELIKRLNEGNAYRIADYDETLKLAEQLNQGNLDIDALLGIATTNLSDSTELITVDKGVLLSYQNDLEAKSRFISVIADLSAALIYNAKRELERNRELAIKFMERMKEQMEKIGRIITQIEIFLGVNEELHQLKVGVPAPADTPISIRQTTMYINEEIGHWKNGGLDYRNIDWFDNWVMEPKNLQRVLPEPKGIAVFKPCRFNKEYEDCSVQEQIERNQFNRNDTYFLIRNGENIYRIFTNNIVVGTYFFPTQELWAQIRGEEKLDPEDRFHRPSKPSEKAQENFIYKYKKNSLLIQGLIERGTLFHPIKDPNLSIFKDKYLNEGEYFNFIKDGEGTLTDGRLRFKDYLKKINSSIEIGSRVLIVGELTARNICSNNFWKYYDGKNLPKVTGGVYEVLRGLRPRRNDFKKLSEFEAFKKDLEAKNIKYTSEENYSERFHSNYETKEEAEAKVIEFEWDKEYDDIKIEESPYSSGKEVDGKMVWERKIRFSILLKKYYLSYEVEVMKIMIPNQAKERYDWTLGFVETKNKISFEISPYDPFVLNYDKLVLEDIEYYLENRLDRPNFLEMMPLLTELRTHLQEERKKEMPFIELLAYKSGKSVEEVMVVTEWWKEKNKYKRRLDKDDTKAFRMCIQKLK